MIRFNTPDAKAASRLPCPGIKGFRSSVFCRNPQILSIPPKSIWFQVGISSLLWRTPDAKKSPPSRTQLLTH
jgi:hypothetical protein